MQNFATFFGHVDGIGRFIFAYLQKVLKTNPTTLHLDNQSSKKRVKTWAVHVIIKKKTRWVYYKSIELKLQLTKTALF